VHLPVPAPVTKPCPGIVDPTRGLASVRCGPRAACRCEHGHRRRGGDALATLLATPQTRTLSSFQPSSTYCHHRHQGIQASLGVRHLSEAGEGGTEERNRRIGSTPPKSWRRWRRSPKPMPCLAFSHSGGGDASPTVWRRSRGGTGAALHRRCAVAARRDSRRAATLALRVG
jgi:hypothetical protein